MSLHMVKAAPTSFSSAPPRSPDRAVCGNLYCKQFSIYRLGGDVCARLEEHKAPAGRARHLPGLGHPLIPPWHVAESGPDGVRMQGVSPASMSAATARSDTAVLRPALRHGRSAAGRPDSRTAYLHVDYRKIAPTDDPLVSRAWIDSVDGRKAFIRAKMTDSDDNVLSEASGLMIKLLPHQP
jgi:hypothetical protein